MANEKIEDMFEELKQQRDELRVQIHLANAEAKEQWQKLENKWDEIEPKLDMVGSDISKTADDVWGALGLMGEAIRDGYQRIKRNLD